MKNKIKYIGFYTTSDTKLKRNSALSAMSKMDYISGVLNKLDYNVSIISPSWIIGKGFEFNKKLKVSENKKLLLPPSIGSSNKFFTYISIILSQVWLFFVLLFTAKKNEKLIVYHSPWLIPAILLAKKIKGFKIILEVEEVYKDVQTIHTLLNKLEEKNFTEADFFIFSTELLEKKINIYKKPFVILYGNYEVKAELEKPIDDGKIHLVYAGIIDSHKAGAFNAIEMAPFLSDNYIIHILGFGEIDKLENRISEINSISACKVVYEGIKSGDDYVRFCQSCHIGLSTQNSEGEYVNSSFPSKILSYMSLGLNVLSCDIACVKQAKVSEFISFYDEGYDKMAISIQNMKLVESSEIKHKILKMNELFIKEIKNILES